MSRKNDVTLLVFSLTAVYLCGCGGEPGGAVPDEVVQEPSFGIIAHNGIKPSDLVAGDIAEKALSPGAWSVEDLAAIMDPSDAGERRRIFIQYVVECALGPSESFSFSWTNSAGKLQEEIYRGELGLAESWAYGPLDDEGEQRWVSACLAARTNYFGYSVKISMRGAAGALASLPKEELAKYTYEEGVFWGNLFAPEPKLYSCFVPENVDYARDLSRECAAGFRAADGQVSPCANIVMTGACSTQCTPLEGGNYHVACSESSNALPLGPENEYVITVFLP